MKVVRVLLLGILFFIGVASWAQSPEAEDCDPVYEEMMESPGRGYARIALWLASHLADVYYSGAEDDGMAAVASLSEPMAAALEYALLSGECKTAQYVFGIVAGMDAKGGQLLTEDLVIFTVMCDARASEMSEALEHGYLRMAGWLTLHLTRIVESDWDYAEELDAAASWYRGLAAALEYALLSGSCAVVEDVFRIVGELDPAGGFLLTMGFADDS